MKRLSILSALMMSFSIAGNALADEQTVELTVDNISCIEFAYEAREVIAAVSGVSRVRIYVASGMAVVTFDDAQTTPEVIAAASAKAGYPARLADAGG